MAFNTLQQPLHIFAQRLNFSRIACVTRLRCRPPDYHIFRGKNGQAPIRAYGVYAWGTSKHGLIPTSEIIDEEQMRLSNQSSSTFLSDTAAAMSVAKDTRSPVFDTPQRLNISKAFNCEREKHTTIQSYFCGHDNSAVIRSDGTCLIWGSNKNGQLGLDDIVERTIPTTLYPPQQLSSSLRFVNGVKHVSLGKTFSAAIDTDGNLHTFGYGGDFFSGMGWLGHGNGDASSVPKRVESLVEDGCEVKDVQVGENHMTVLTSEGEVLTAGGGSYGRLGNLETTDQLFLEPVELLAGQETIQISVGHSFTLALTKDGIVHGWGRNDKGQLGTGGGLMVDMYAMSNLPAPIEGQLENRNVTKIAAGHSHSACVTDRGELFMWGMQRHLEPELMTTLLDTKCIDLSCGENYTMALTEDHKLFSFGKGKTGVLGLGNSKTVNVPTLVEGITEKDVVAITAGSSHVACLVRSDSE